MKNIVIFGSGGHAKVILNEILNLEKKFDFKDKDSPSKTLGFTPSKNFEKYPHRVKMLSLANAFDEEDLINFEKKIINFLNLNKNIESFSGWTTSLEQDKEKGYLK